MAKMNTAGSSKTDDFSQFQDASRWMGDFSKFFTTSQMPVVDFDGIIAAQRKNIEALNAASQLCCEGALAVAERQGEIARQAVEEFTKAAKEMANLGTPEEKLAQQADLAKAGFEQAALHLQGLGALVQKSNAKAFEVLSKRAAANFDEVKAALKKTAKK